MSNLPVMMVEEFSEGGVVLSAVGSRRRQISFVAALTSSLFMLYAIVGPAGAQPQRNPMLRADSAVSAHPAATRPMTPIGEPAPPVLPATSTSLVGKVTSTTSVPGARDQSLEFVMRIPRTVTGAIRLRILLPVHMNVSPHVYAVRLDGPPQHDVAVKAVTHRPADLGAPQVPGAPVIPTPRTTAVDFTFTRSQVIKAQSVVRVWLSTVVNPAAGKTFVPVRWLDKQSKVLSQGTLTLLTGSPAIRCPSQRNPAVIAQENAKAGSQLWNEITAGSSRVAEGFASRTSASCGDVVDLHVNTSSTWFTIWAWRMGNYAGTGGRLVWRSGPIMGSRGSAPIHHTVTEPDPYGVQPAAIDADWPVSLKMNVTAAFTPGVYLLQIRGSDGGRAWIPLVVRDSVGTPAVGVLIPTNTWQVYNAWGGASGYRGADALAESRSRIVSFNRPFAGRGDGQLVANQLPFIEWAEGTGKDVTYFTDDDLNSGSQRLTAINALIIPGHSEYWTAEMRANLQRLITDRGGNVAFLGANDMYWRPRVVSSSSDGSIRELAIFRYQAEDVSQDPADISVRWRDAPISSPEQELLGSQYWCLKVDDSYVVPDNPGWPFAWGGQPSGTVIPHLVYREIDRVDPSLPYPSGLRALAQAPISCTARTPVEVAEWDAVAYETSAHGAVLAMGTLGWTCQLTGECPYDPNDAVTVQFVQRVTDEVVRVFGAGPAGLIVRSAGVPWQSLPVPPPSPDPSPTG